MTTNAPLRALVTGATGGVGRATCHALIEDARHAGRQAVLAVAASSRGAALDALVLELTAAGARAFGLHADLGDAAACEQLAADAVAACDGLDVLVSNAGAMAGGPLLTLPVEHWNRIFDLDTRATWLLARAAYPALEHSRGNVVAIASMAGLQPFPNSGAYSASKAALIMLCRQLAQEWAPVGIRVNSVSPGMLRTPMTESLYQNDEVRTQRERLVPLGRIGTPQDVAQAVCFLAGAGAGYVTGIDLRLDGGVCDRLFGLIPGLPAPRPAPPA